MTCRMLATVLIALLLGGTSAWADSPKQARSSQNPVEQHSDAREFLQVLKDLADNGNLFDSTSVSKQLGMEFNAETKEQIPQPPACEHPWYDRSNIKTTMTLVGSSWYRDMPTGISNMTIPAAFINPADNAGKVSIGYSITRIVACTNSNNFRNRSVATFAFGGLPSFACVSDEAIRKWLPEAKFVMATDGVHFFTYQGRVDDEAGTYVRIFGRTGVSCAIGADVTQDQWHGLRYARAESKWMSCKANADKEFRAQNRPITGSDTDKLDQMYDNANQVCGTRDSLLDHDSEGGVLPDPQLK